MIQVLPLHSIRRLWLLHGSKPRIVLRQKHRFLEWVHAPYCNFSRVQVSLAKAASTDQAAGNRPRDLHP